MPRGERTNSRTRGETIYDALRKDIVLGLISPGSRVHLSDRAKSEGVSLSVVREAASRLASEGLLRSEPQLGFWVPELSIGDLEDLAWTRMHIETLAVRESIIHGDLEWEAALVAAHHALSATPVLDEDDTYNHAWMIAHNRFHTALAAACPYPRMRQIRQQLFDASELYRYWSGHGSTGATRVAREHKAILDAALARDPDRTVARLTDHLERTTRRLRKLVEKSGEHLS